MQRTNQQWIPWAGLFLTIGGIVYQAGGITSSIKRADERIAKLESSDDARSTAINAINVRTARIEAKLDYALPPKKEDIDR